jgi:putative ABC transport system permease protein
VSNPAPTSHGRMVLRETLRVALDSFRANRVRFALTALGMVIGTASLILVVTIGLTGKQYILNQINAIGANLIYAYYDGGGNVAIRNVPQDFLTVADMRAVQEQVPGIRAASPMVELYNRIAIGGGRERDILVLGVAPAYREVRNLRVPAGRFFDDEDERARAKVAVVTAQFAERQYGSQHAAVGRTMNISGLPFTIIGTFREQVETFGMSEVKDDTIVIPYSVSRYFTGTDTVKQLFFSVADTSQVPQATEHISRILHARHRPESIYRVENLTQVLDVAARSANALTAVLLLVAAVTLLVSGVGIMNIMLATVNARIREIGIRKAIGATRREIRLQFLSEAVLISLAGGVVGIVLGLAMPYSVRFFTEHVIPISGWSVVIALAVSSLVGVLFGTVPAARAAQLDPVESLRYE